MNPKEMDLATRVVHAGQPEPRIERAAVVPIFQCSVYENVDDGVGYGGVRYPRMSNLPGHLALNRKLAALEGAEDAMVTASGMAAISVTLLEVLGGGGHLLVQDQLYGGTHGFVTRDLRRFGLDYDLIQGNDPGSWKAKLRSNTRAIYVETMTNPLVRVADHEAVVAFARENDLVSIIDNTFATPVNFRPAERGFDLSVHSCTKYLNGHSDLVAGAVIGSRELIGRIAELQLHLGGSLDPHACYLLDRGVKTLVLRLRQQNASGATLARFLAEHPAVERVNHPALEQHPDHARARRLLDGFGGMLSFEPKGGLEGARRFLSRVHLPINGPSLGGPETLVTRPCTTSHANMDADERRAAGIADGLIRVSVGIEAVEDLIQDFGNALG